MNRSKTRLDWYVRDGRPDLEIRKGWRKTGEDLQLTPVPPLVYDKQHPPVVPAGQEKNGDPMPPGWALESVATVARTKDAMALG